MAKAKAISVRFSDEELTMIKKLSKDLHISQSETVRQFVSKDKIIVIKAFEKLLPLLGAVANIIQNGEHISDEYEQLKLEVYRIWKLLGLKIKDQ